MAVQDWFEKDFYAVLGVGKEVSPADLKKAYRKLARRLHPDANPGNFTTERRFADVGEAYSVLSDPEQRQKYDAIRSSATRASVAPSADVDQWIQDLFPGLFGPAARPTPPRQRLRTATPLDWYVASDIPSPSTKNFFRPQVTEAINEAIDKYINGPSKHRAVDEVSRWLTHMVVHGRPPAAFSEGHSIRTLLAPVAAELIGGKSFESDNAQLAMMWWLSKMVFSQKKLNKPTNDREVAALTNASLPRLIQNNLAKRLAAFDRELRSRAATRGDVGAQALINREAERLTDLLESEAGFTSTSLSSLSTRLRNGNQAPFEKWVGGNRRASAQYLADYVLANPNSSAATAFPAAATRAELQVMALAVYDLTAVQRCVADGVRVGSGHPAAKQAVASLVAAKRAFNAALPYPSGVSASAVAARAERLGLTLEPEMLNANLLDRTARAIKLVELDTEVPPHRSQRRLRDGGVTAVITQTYQDQRVWLAGSGPPPRPTDVAQCVARTQNGPAGALLGRSAEDARAVAWMAAVIASESEIFKGADLVEPWNWPSFDLFTAERADPLHEALSIPEPPATAREASVIEFV